MDEKRGTAERVARTIINMLAGVGLLYLCEIFQIAGRINSATAEGYDVEAYNPPPMKSRR